MKPAPFAYAAPRTLDEALELLAANRDEARVLAGGQSLVAAMNFRLARPGMLIDINRIPGLDIARVENGRLRIGALARHARFETPVADRPLGKLMAKAARHIAHPPIRTRGTFAGSLAYADPSAEWCALALMLDAEITAQSAAASRSIPAVDFFQGTFTTALEAGEMITEVALPNLGDDWRTGFAEISRRAGDYAIVLAVAALRLEDGAIAEARIGLGGVVGKPVRSPEAEAALIGHGLANDRIACAAEAAMASVEPFADTNASSDYRRILVGAMVRRALVDARGS